MKASIVILNWNGGAHNCLEAVGSALAQDHADKEVIFVDNGSQDDSLAAVRKHFPEIRILALPENIGCPPGRNRGAELATGDLLFFLENDGAWIEHDLVSQAVALFERHTDLGALYTRVEGYATRNVDKPLDGIPGPATTTGLYLSSSFRGGASVIRRGLFNTLGGFPDDFFRQGEESFISLRIFEAGYKVAYWPGRVMLHKGSDYPGKANSVSRYRFENEIKTILRLYPWYDALTLTATKWAYYLLVFSRQGRLDEFLRITGNLLPELAAFPRRTRISKQTLYLAETLKTARFSLDLESQNISVAGLAATIERASPVLEALKRLVRRPS